MSTTQDPRVGSITDRAIPAAVQIAQRLLARFDGVYPDDTTTNGVYPMRPARFGEPVGGNTEWTTGFLPGLLWALGEVADDEVLLDGAHAHVDSFVDRLDRRVDLATHDLGFLYTLSCVTAWRHRRDETARSAALGAAEALMTRFLEPAGIIQAWGDLADPSQQGRTIIDSLMNMPLLYWATETTGERRFRSAAVRHTRALRDHIVRGDDTTHHTFHWDPVTGAPLRGSTAQGFGDESCWARGQAWGIYGFALGYRHTGDESLLATSIRLANYFLAHLPADRVAYWDLEFTDGDAEERDSSAAAIAVCGLFELASATGSVDYQTHALQILAALATGYATDGTGEADCLLLHGVYDKNENKGVDEGTLWGDYFYAEALLRNARPDWVPYWHPGTTMKGQ